MFKKVAVRKRIYLFVLSTLFILSWFSFSCPFIYAADTSDSSPVPATDFSNFFPYKNGIVNIQDQSNGNIGFTGTQNTSGLMWTFNNLSFAFDETPTYFITRNVYDYEASDINVTIQDHYRYCISFDVFCGLTEGNDVDWSSSYPTFYLYLSSGSSSDVECYPINYSSFEWDSETQRRRFIFDFSFNSDSLIPPGSNVIKNGDSYKVAAWALKWSNRDSYQVSKAVLRFSSRDILVYSPDDWQSLQIVEGITQMDPETFDKFSGVLSDEESVQDDIMNDIESILPEKPDYDFSLDESFGKYVTSFDYVSRWLQDVYVSTPVVRYTWDIAIGVSILLLILKLF